MSLPFLPSTADAPSWTRWALGLAWFTILFNLAEGATALAFGWSEGSMALLGFGLDSWIEVSSAVVVLWRLRGETGRGEGLSRDRERSASRVIGGLLALLGATAAAGGMWRLAVGGSPSSTVPGMIIAGVSLSFMFVLWRAKRQAARALDSRTLELDAACSRGCIELSAVLLAGSLLQFAFPALWWADAAAACVLGGLILREGVEGLRAASKPDFDGGCGCG